MAKNPEEEELTPEQMELLEKAAAEAEEEAKVEWTGFASDCEDHGPRVKVNGILLCSKCDFVKINDGKAKANPPKPKD